MNIDKKNSEGYIDMTSYEALTILPVIRQLTKKLLIFRWYMFVVHMQEMLKTMWQMQKCIVDLP